jgi:photosystem II stability/assembly factor-like uncharacterized protein
MKQALIYIIALPLLLIAAEWQSLNGPPAGRADDMSIGYDNSVPGWIIYAADQTHKLYKSTNEGELWEPITDEHIIQPTCVITRPGDAQVVYIGKNDNVPIWWSTNGGQTWEERSGEYPNNITNTQPLCFAMDPNDVSVVYLGCRRSSVSAAMFKTTNSGATWSALSNSPNASVNDIAITHDPLRGTWIYAGCSDTEKGIWKSTDGGDTWTQIFSGDDIYAVAFANQFVGYAGAGQYVYKTTNGGDAWQCLNSPDAEIRDLSVVSTAVVYAATNDAIFKTTNGGADWIHVSTGHRCDNANCILTHPSSNQTIFSGAAWCVYKTTNSGSSWFEIIEGYRPASIKKLTANLPNMYTVGNDYLGRGSCAITRSSDNGDNWITLTGYFPAEGTGEHCAQVITVSPRNADIVLMGGHWETVESENQAFIYRTSDYGETWQRTYQSPDVENYVYSIEFSPFSSDTVYTGLGAEYVIMRSTNTGISWAGQLEGQRIMSLAINDDNEDIVYGGAKYSGVFKSTNAGGNWSQTDFDDRTVPALSIDCDFPNIVYAGTGEPVGSSYGVYKTINAFSSYPLQANNGLDYLYIGDLDIDPTEPTIVYALCKANLSSSETYVYCSVDRGGKWFDMTDGLPEENVNDLEIDRDVPDPVFAATENGMFTYTPDFNKHLVSSVDTATFANNGRNMMRIEGTDEIWVTYESGGVIYVTYTTNAGFSWSKKMELGQGSCPAISYDPIAETPIPGVVWRYRDSEYNYAVYFSRYTGSNQWSEPEEVASSESAIDPPSLTIGGGNVGHLAYTEGSTVKYAYFSITNPSSVTRVTVGTGHNPCIGYMTSGTNPNIHIVWEYDDQIWYRYSPFGLGSPERVSSSVTDCYHPSLVVNGNVVYFAWEADGDIFWRWITHNYPFTAWGAIKQVCSTGEINSSYPVLTNGYYCSWVEEQSGAYEVYAADYDPEETSWNTPQNISDGANETFSNLPHIVHKQTLFGTTVYFTWTEGYEGGAQPTAPPYRIVFTVEAFGETESSGRDALPMYVAECGEETASPFTTHREGYAHYGTEPYKRIDYDTQYLEYRFTHLDPDMIYTLQAYLYQHGTSNLPITFTIDDHQFTPLNLPPDTLIIKEHVVPDLLYNDGQITLKILGNKAVSALLVLSEFEHDHKGGGPQGTEGLAGMPDCFSLGAYPCPTSNALVMEYAVPIAGVVHITLYDAAGRCVQEINNAYMQPGMYQKQVDLTGIAQGVYFLRLESNNEVITRKTIVLR